MVNLAIRTRASLPTGRHELSAAVSTRRVLDEATWRPRAAAHARPGRRLSSQPHLARRRGGVAAPGARLPLHLLLPAAGAAAALAPGLRRRAGRRRAEYAGLKGYARPAPVPRRPRHVAAQRPLLESLHRLLTRDGRPAAHLGCFGLHEWAMVYRPPDADPARRLAAAARARPAPTTVVESHRIACSHFDAFRFFTDAGAAAQHAVARPRRPARLEQPGCLHAGDGPLQARLPADARWSAPTWSPTASSSPGTSARLDMRASPYDLADLGFEPVRIETAGGKQEYAAAQRGSPSGAAPLRDRLVDVCDWTVLIDACDPPLRPLASRTRPPPSGRRPGLGWRAGLPGGRSSSSRPEPVAARSGRHATRSPTTRRGSRPRRPGCAPTTCHDVPRDGAPHGPPRPAGAGRAGLADRRPTAGGLAGADLAAARDVPAPARRARSDVRWTNSSRQRVRPRRPIGHLRPHLATPASRLGGTGVVRGRRRGAHGVSGGRAPRAPRPRLPPCSSLRRSLLHVAAPRLLHGLLVVGRRPARRTPDPRWVFYIRDKTWYASPWFGGRHRIMIPFGCTEAPYYSPDPPVPRTSTASTTASTSRWRAAPSCTPPGGRPGGPERPLGPAYGTTRCCCAPTGRLGPGDRAHPQAVTCAPGDVVRRGTLIALASDNGAPDGCHLHFEKRAPGGGLDTATYPQGAARPRGPSYRDDP